MLSRPARTHQPVNNKRKTNRTTPVFVVAMASSTQGVSAFLQTHDLQAKIEDALNRVVKAKPDEPLSFLVGHSRDRPTIGVWVLKGGGRKKGWGAVRFARQGLRRRRANRPADHRARCADGRRIASSVARTALAGVRAR
jgi:hypothetical protein